MQEYLVLYEEPCLIKTLDKGSYYDYEGHALVVEAENEVQAFIVAFDILTRRGHMVRTIKPGETPDELVQSQQQQRTYTPDVYVTVIAGLTLDQMQQIWSAGIPVIGGRGDTRKMTNIISIHSYSLELTPSPLAL